jgi:hypothetical protein
MDLPTLNVFPGGCTELLSLFQVQVQHPGEECQPICLEPALHRRHIPSPNQLELFISGPAADGYLADGFMVVHKADCGNHLFQRRRQTEWPANFIGGFIQSIIVSGNRGSFIGAVVSDSSTIGPFDDFNESAGFEMSAEV